MDMITCIRKDEIVVAEGFIAGHRLQVFELEKLECRYYDIFNQRMEPMLTELFVDVKKTESRIISEGSEIYSMKTKSMRPQVLSRKPVNAPIAGRSY